MRKLERVITLAYIYITAFIPCFLKRETEFKWLNLIVEVVSPLSIYQHLETHYLKWTHWQLGINPGPCFFHFPGFRLRWSWTLFNWLGILKPKLKQQRMTRSNDKIQKTPNVSQISRTHFAIGAGRSKNAVSVMCSKIRLKRRGNKDIGSDW